MRISIIIFFLLGCLFAVIWWMPVGFVINTIDAKGSMTFEAATGTLSSGSLVLTNNEITALPVGWKICSIKLTQPFGLCLDITRGESKVYLSVVPWKLGDVTSIYNMIIDSPVAKLADLGPSLALLSTIEGHLQSNIQTLVYNRRLGKLIDLQGELFFSDLSTFGLDIGDVNVEITQPKSGDNIELVFEGGDINEIVLLGSGIFDPQSRNLSIRTVFRSSKPSVTQQLEIFAKKTGENSYEWVYTTVL